MKVEVRDNLRHDIITKLMDIFPTAVKVEGGIAFLSPVVDEDTGKNIPVEILVSAKLTADTPKAKAYDIDEAARAFAAKPGRRVKDEAKAAEREAAKKLVAERREANLAILRDYIAKGGLDVPKTTTEIWNEITEFHTLLVLQVGSLLSILVKNGEVKFSMDGKRHRVYEKNN